MPARRDTPDGLPFNCYERKGTRTYSIGYKAGRPRRWLIRESCPVDNPAARQKLRRDVLKRIADLQAGSPQGGSFRALSEAWLAHEQAKPAGSEGRRAATTLAENAREIAKLNQVMGDAQADELEKADGYAYLDQAERLGRSAKGNKEISIARTIFEWGVQRGRVAANPFSGIRRLVTKKYDRRVTDGELALAVEVGRRRGGASLIVALALKTAWLCLRRSVEVRDFQHHQIGAEGITWTGAKRKRGSVAKEGLIEWSPSLRATIDEALALQRFDRAPVTFYVFGNMMGQKYTKGGWKKMLHGLMEACVAEAAGQGVAFQKFSLQDCRPMGVTTKMERGDRDVQDATLHSSGKMIEATYDRRKVRVAKPAA